MMNRRVQALSGIDILRLEPLLRVPAPIHLGQNTHEGELDEDLYNLGIFFSRRHLWVCNALNCSQLRLEVLMKCPLARAAYSDEEIQIISNNFENYLHDDRIYDCIHRSLTNQLDFMLWLNGNPPPAAAAEVEVDALFETTDDEATDDEEER